MILFYAIMLVFVLLGFAGLLEDVVESNMKTFSKVILMVILTTAVFTSVMTITTKMVSV